MRLRHWTSLTGNRCLGARSAVTPGVSRFVANYSDITNNAIARPEYGRRRGSYARRIIASFIARAMPSIQSLLMDFSGVDSPDALAMRRWEIGLQPRNQKYPSTPT